MRFTIEIVREGQIVAKKSGEEEVYLFYDCPYEEGDIISITSDEDGFVSASIDSFLSIENGFFRQGRYIFPIPFGRQRICYHPYAFDGEKHLISIRHNRDYERNGVRNLALNPLDCHSNEVLFPHAYANVETRGEAAFEARNAIDGLIASSGHGKYPFSSWGINRDPNAQLTVDFGRNVVIKAISIYTRADFPHDAWWKSARIAYGDGQVLELSLEKKDGEQYFVLDQVVSSYITIYDLIKADDPSPFPALVQLKVWGEDRI